MSEKNKILMAVVMIALGVVCRLLPHPWNFAPIAGVALFAGAYLGVRYAVVVPLAAMLIGDIFIGFYAWQLMVAVYFSYALIGLMGILVKKDKSIEAVVAGSLVASVLFFIVTNFTVWQFSPWYAKSVAGLLECYAMALPFFRNTFLGDLFYTSVFFGAYEILRIWASKRQFAFKYQKNS